MITSDELNKQLLEEAWNSFVLWDDADGIKKLRMTSDAPYWMVHVMQECSEGESSEWTEDAVAEILFSLLESCGADADEEGAACGAVADFSCPTMSKLLVWIAENDRRILDLGSYVQKVTNVHLVDLLVGWLMQSSSM